MTEILIPEKIEDVPVWNFDGSSTGQADIENSDRFLKPVYMCNNPFTKGSLVLCAVYDNSKCTIPNKYNTFDECNKVLMKYENLESWFGFEQEYFIVDENISPTIRHYCGVGEGLLNEYIPKEHAKLCVKAGICIYGTNAEVSPSQWEYQIGTIQGIEAAHQLWLSRYILLRVSEKYFKIINFHPKPYLHLNGSGCHTNYSDFNTRFKHINLSTIFNKLSKTHNQDILNYGADNNLRLTGTHETASIEKFSWGISTRNTSIRITSKDSEYFEDRRPASNCDPYLVCMMLVKNIGELSDNI
jgi:glutamine synthetase